MLLRRMAGRQRFSSLKGPVYFLQPAADVIFVIELHQVTANRLLPQFASLIVLVRYAALSAAKRKVGGYYAIVIVETLRLYGLKGRSAAAPSPLAGQAFPFSTPGTARKIVDTGRSLAPTSVLFLFCFGVGLAASR